MSLASKGGAVQNSRKEMIMCVMGNNHSRIQSIFKTMEQSKYKECSKQGL